jgi:hypothetical protein
MAKPKSTNAQKKRAANGKRDDAASLYRKFRELDRLWRASDRAYKSAIEAAQAQYPKPTGHLEQILLLNQTFFRGEIHAPIPAHEELLVKQCDAESQDKGVFERNYQRLQQWRQWRAQCQQIDRALRMAGLRSEHFDAYERRGKALEAFAEAPAKSAEEIILKLRHLIKMFGDEDPAYRYPLVHGMIKDLEDGAAARAQ